ncbi:MAG: phage holin family protein [Xylanivirga thermophila]|uniref:phage holin family protein n=1 Tax=Xylanivirga thermophila TaxID=2496273 RepID=UPI0013ECC908|nr:phage holin family protein [Xylanivirga thermophila]
MKKQILKLACNILAFYLASLIIPSGVSISGGEGLVIAALVLWVINILIRPLLLLITIPINVFTLGIFTLVVDSWMIMLTGKIVNGLTIYGFWAAFLIALIVTLLNEIINSIKQ